MPNKIYEFKGKRFNISNEDEEAFLKDLPSARLVTPNKVDAYNAPKTEVATKEVEKPIYETPVQQVDTVADNLTIEAPKEQMVSDTLDNKEFVSDLEQPIQKPVQIPNNVTFGEAKPQGIDFNKSQEQRRMDYLTGNSDKPVGLFEPKEDVFAKANKDVYKDRKAQKDFKQSISTQVDEALIKAKEGNKEQSFKDTAQKQDKEADKDKSALRKMFEMGTRGGMTPTVATDFTDRMGGGAYGVAEYFLEDSQRLIKEAGKEKNWAKAIGRGMKDSLFSVENWSFGITEADRNSQISTAVAKHEAGEKLTEAETAMMDALALNLATNQYYSEDIQRQYGWGETAGVSTPYMIEFMLNPISGTGKGIAKGIAKYGIKKFGQSAAKAGIKRTATKVGARAIGELSQGIGMMATSGSAKTYADALDRMTGDGDYNISEDGKIEYAGHTGGKSAMTSITQAMTAAMLEYQSEAMGDSGLLGTMLNNNAMRGIAKGLKTTQIGNLVGRMNASSTRQAFKQLEKKAQWNGLFEEWFEEAYGTFMNAALVGDQKFSDLKDLDQQIDTFMGLSVTAGTMSALRTASYGKDRVQTGKQLRTAKQELANHFDNFDGVIKQFQNLSAEERLEDLVGILSRDDITSKAKQSFVKYAQVQSYHDALTGAGEAIEERNQEDAQKNGERLATTMQDQRSIALNRLSLEMEGLEAQLGEFADAPWDELLDSGMSDEMYQAKSQYGIAKAEYETVLNTVKKDAQGTIETLNKAIDDVTRQDGTVIEVELGTLEKPDKRYVVSGQVEFHPEEAGGGVNKVNSDNTIIVKDEQGKNTQVSIATVNGGGINDAAEMKAEAQQQAYKMHIDPLVAKLEGRTSFDEGQHIQYTDEKGEAHSATVVETTPETTTVVSNDGKKTTTHETNTLGQQIIGESVGEYNIRDTFVVYIDGVPYNAEIQNVTEGKAEVHIPGATQANERIQDLTAAQIDAMRINTEAKAEFDPFGMGEEDSQAQEAAPQTETTEVSNDSQTQLPTDKTGNTVYEEIKEPTTYLQALTQEFGEDTAEIVQSKQAEAKKTLEETVKINDIIERKRAEKEAKENIQFWNDVQTLQQTQIKEEAFKNTPDVTVDSAKEARKRGFRSVNGEMVERQPVHTAEKSTDIERKFSETETVKGKRTLVESKGVQASHINGVANPMFFITEAQPKKRTDEASQSSADGMAANMNNEEITGGVTAYTGAPSVNSNLEVIQGNNRTRAIQLMYEHYPEKAAAYKQHLADNAADYGMTAEEVLSMYRPMAIDMLEINDDKAIKLGQLSAADTESGGMQRIAPQQTATSLGENVKAFANILFLDTDGEASISELSVKNGRKALEYLSIHGHINPTQVQSALDADGNVTPEARKDLQDIASSVIFEGGSDNLRLKFDALPAKAQKSILQTIHRDADSSKEDSIISEIQDSIEAYYILQQDAQFANSKSYEAALIAASDARAQSALFQQNNNLPLQKYSNFAMELAVLYKTDTQKALRTRFNDFYDGVQGVGSTLFGQAEAITLKEAINKHFNKLDYVPIGQKQRNVVDSNIKESEKRRQSGTGETDSSQQDTQGEQPTDNRTGVDGDNEGLKTKLDGRTQLQFISEIGKLQEMFNTTIIPHTSTSTITDQSVIDAIKKGTVKGWYDVKTGMVNIFLPHNTSIADIQTTYLHEVIGHKGVRDMLGAGYEAMLDKVYKALPLNAAASAFKRFKNNPTYKDRSDTYIKRLIADEFIAEIAESSGYNAQNESIFKAIIEALKDFFKINKLEYNYGTAEKLATQLVQESAARLKAKVKVDTAAAQVDTNPTEAQKEAGNYKMGHVTISGLDISIENKKGGERKGIDANGKEWSITMNNHYGYIKGTNGIDGDHIDVFIGENPESERVFVVDQMNSDSTFDEHKVMLGFDTKEEAQEAYLSNYEEGWTGMGAVTDVSIENFKAWVDVDTKKSKPFAEYKQNQKATDKETKESSYKEGSKVSIDFEGTTQEVTISADVTGDKVFFKTSEGYVESLPIQEFNNSVVTGKESAQFEKKTPKVQGITKTKAELLAEVKAALAKEKKVQIPDKSETNGYQIYETDIKRKDGAHLKYGVPTVENKNKADGSTFGNGLHETLEDAIRETKENAQKEIDNADKINYDRAQRELADREAKEKEERNKGKTAAEIMQQGRVDKYLEVNRRFADYGVLTRREFLHKILEEGGSVTRHVIEGKTVYRANTASGSFFDSTKFGFDYFNSLPKPESPKVETKKVVTQAEVEDLFGEGVFDQEPKAKPTNTIVSKDAVEAAKARMRANMNNLNVGFNPQIFSDGIIIGIDLIESGVRTLADFTKKMVETFGDNIKEYSKALFESIMEMPSVQALLKGDKSGAINTDLLEAGSQYSMLELSEGDVSFSAFSSRMIDALGEDITPFLKSFYIGAKNMPGMETIAEKMDNEKVVRITRVKKQDITTSNKRDFVNAIKDKLGVDKLNIVSIRKIAAEYGFVDVKDTKLQEYVELALIEKAKDIRNQDISQEQKYDQIVELYNSQPTISMRSSERIEKQQYSTPLPISFLAGEFINGINPQTTLEPSAGNGMMVFNIDPRTVIANEIDEVRLENLREQPFKEVTNQDGTKEFNIERVDAIVTNPPFGKSPARDYEGFKISGLDEQMVVNALSSMKDTGRASIIIGGHTKYKSNGTLAAQKAFINYLYDKYNVSDIINIDGGLYSKQGTSFPVRLILIDGRRVEQERRFAPLEKDVSSEEVKTFEELYTRINNINNEKDLLHERDTRTSNDGVKPTTEGNRDTVSGVSTTTNQQVEGRGGQPSTPSTRPNVDGRLSDTKQPSTVDDAGGRNLQPVQESGQPTNGRSTTGNTRGVSKQDTLQFLDGTDAKPESLKVDISKEKSPYPARSKSGAIGSVVPTNVAQSLSAILAKFNDIDAYVQSKLGYETKEELYGALAAEQIDSVALAIYQIENGKALIIGDMTGVGKGRQAAAILRYAARDGRKPIFVTEKADLFSDMYRDLRDIGSAELIPLIVNSKGQNSNPAMTDENGVVIYDTLSDAAKKNIFETGEIPEEYDYAVLTYSQLSGDFKKKGESIKQTFFRSIAADNILILDESHNAGGDGNTGKFMSEVLPLTKGVTFLSGTFAKRADNMPIYALKTSMNEANMSEEELISAILAGGVALQEIMSKNLTESGQMIRRERDFTGVVIDWQTMTDKKAEHYKTFDSVIDIFNQLISFQKDFIDPIVEGLSKGLEEQQGSMETRKGTSKLGISNTPFASKTFNAVRQMLFSLKAEEVAQEAIKEIQAGRKPVVAVDNTMGSFLSELGGDGDVISNHDFSLTLMKGLAGMFRVTESDAYGNSTHSEIDRNLLSAEGKAKYSELEELINKASSGISISPIDVIKKQIEDAGYSIGELTGRDNVLVFNEDGTATITKREDRDKKKIARDFNSGALDALILNKSASTGISLHASDRFADQKQRVMLFAQNQLDVNTEVQMRGRIDRTGQVQRGAYRYIISPIPAEQRMIMMFKAKLKSLDANTTSSQKSEVNEIDVVDFLNKYGDEIVIEYLKENPDINEKMLDPFNMSNLDENALSNFTSEEGASNKASGRAALLTVKEQEAFYNEVTEKYTNIINYLNDSGTNDLEITTMPLNAETVKKHVVVQGKNNDNPFSEDSILETVEVDVLKKPMAIKEALSEVERNTGGLSAVDYRTSIIEKIDNYEKESVAAEEAKVEEQHQKKEEAFEKRIEGEASALLKKETITDKEAYLQERRNERSEGHLITLERRTEAIKNRSQSIRRAFQGLRAGQIVMIPSTLDIGLDTSYTEGMFLGFRMKDKLTPSTITAVFATLDSRRRIDVPLSKISFINAVRSETQQNARYIKATNENWDKRIPTRTRRTAHVVTGNILQAYGRQELKGQLVSFSTSDGQIRQGILLPEKYTPTEQTMRVQVIGRLDALKQGLTLSDLSNKVSIKNEGNGYTINVPRSKVRGGKYFLDSGLRDLVSGRDFRQMRGEMVGFVNERNIKKALQYLSDKFNISVDVGMKEVKEDSKGDVRYRGESSIFEKRPQFTQAADKVIESFGSEISLKENESRNNSEKQRDRVKSIVLFDGVKDYGLYDKYEIVPENNPIININNVNQSIYGLGVELGYVNKLHSKGLLDFVNDTGELDSYNVKEFSERFNSAITPYEEALLKAKHLSTEAAQREIISILEDIDHAKDYYERLSKDHSVLRSEDAPRFRKGDRQVLTPEFKKWFKDSKVVNTDGSPMVVYHGTGVEFNEFIAQDKNNSLFYFAEDKDYAIQRDSKFLIEAYLTIQKPFDATIVGVGDISYHKVKSLLEKYKVELTPKIEKMVQNFSAIDVPFWRHLRFDEDLQRNIAKAGYDGISLMEYSGDKQTVAWAAFKPTQIKSSTDNDGGFDPSNPDIRFRTADKLFDNIDNLQETVEDYPKFLNNVLQGSPVKSMILDDARRGGYSTLSKSVEQYLSKLQDPKELARIKDALDVEMPDNALQYVLWRNANPNDGSAVWKAKNAIREHELKYDVLYRGGQKLFPAINNAYENRVSNKTDKWYSKKRIKYEMHEGYVDRMISLRHLQEAIVGGAKIADGADAYIMENLLSSKNQAQIADFVKNMIDPTVEAAQRIFGEDMDTIDLYLIAKHGLERNEVMARKEAFQDVEKRTQEAYAKIDADTESKINAIVELQLESDQNTLGAIEDEFRKIADANKKLAAEKIRRAAEKKFDTLVLEKDYAGLTALALERGMKETEFREAGHQIVEEMNNKYNENELNNLWLHINKANNWMLKKQYENGMLTKERYDEISSMYQNYVPLRGFDEAVGTDMFDYLVSPPSTFSSVLRKAKGRTSRASSPMANMINMAESGIMQANRNRMKQAFYRLVVTSDTDLATVRDVWTVIHGDGEWMEEFPHIPETATAEESAEILQDFEDRMQDLEEKGLAKKKQNELNIGMKIFNPQAAEHAVRVWVNGEEKVVYVNGNPRAAQALNGLTNPAMQDKSQFRKGIEYLNRQMSANFTSRNPVFLVTNFSRDMQFALMAASVKEGAYYSAQLALNATKVGKTIAQNVWGKGNANNPELQKLYEEFVMNGGETGYANLQTVDHHRKYVNDKLRSFSDKRDWKLPFRVYARNIENTNQLIENNTRFATYVTSRQQGRSIQKSVYDAKEITVNFNRKGSGGAGASALHGLFLFSNPTIQAANMLAGMAKKRPKQLAGLMGTVGATGFIVPFLNEVLLNMFGDDDDKELYYNINPWVRRNNLVMYMPWTKDKFVTIMLPHEVRAIYAMGEMAYGAITGNARHENLPKEAMGMISDMLPIDMAGSHDWFVPDAGKPIWQAYVSKKNFMDRPIYKDGDWNKKYPDWTKAYKSTPQPLVDMYKWINEITGGDDVKKGLIDLNPAVTSTLFNGYMGGFGKIWTDVGTLFYDMTMGNDVSVNQVPFASKMIRTSDEQTKEMRLNSEYFYYSDWVRDFTHLQKGYEKKLSEEKYVEKYRKLYADKNQLRAVYYAKHSIAAIKKAQDVDEQLAMKLKKKFVERMHDWEDKGTF